MKKYIYSSLIILLSITSFGQTGTCDDPLPLGEGLLTLTSGETPQWYLYTNTKSSTQEVTIRAGEFGEYARTKPFCSATFIQFDGSNSYILEPNQSLRVTHSSGLVDLEVSSAPLEQGTDCGNPFVLSLDSLTDINENDWYSYSNKSDEEQYLFIKTSSIFLKTNVFYDCTNSRSNYSGPSLNRVSLSPGETIYIIPEGTGRVTLSLENTSLEGRYCSTAKELTSEGTNLINSFTPWYKYENNTLDTLAITYNTNSSVITYYFKECKNTREYIPKSSRYNVLLYPGETLKSYFQQDLDLDLLVEKYVGSTECNNPVILTESGTYRTFTNLGFDQLFKYTNNTTSFQRVTAGNCSLTNVFTGLRLQDNICINDRSENSETCDNQNTASSILAPNETVVIRWVFNSFERDNFNWTLETETIDAVNNKKNRLNIDLFPTPATESINFSSIVDDAILKDMNGKVILFSKSTQSLDVIKLKPGVYLLELRKDEKIVTKKVTIQ